MATGKLLHKRHTNNTHTNKRMNRNKKKKLEKKEKAPPVRKAPRGETRLSINGKAFIMKET